MEINQDGANYKALKFHCDWVAHPVLDRGEAKIIVQDFDKWQALTEELWSAPAGQLMPGQLSTLTKSFLETINERLRLSRFRRELGAYLTQQGLDSSIADDDQKWVNFLVYYTRVIEDCPLRCKGLPYTDEVVLKVLDIRPAGSQLVIEWSWVSKHTGIRSVNQQFY
jgi:hypothetical protein